jgi:aldose 1-epimerase
VTSRRLELRAGRLEVRLLPAVGGSIVGFDRIGEEGRQPLLRGAVDDITDVLDASCFPLVPFANRIRGGQFECDGRRIRLAPDMAGDPSPLHGQGWKAAWTLVDSTDRSAELVYRHDAGEWPWEYEARQTIAVDEAGLSLRLSCRNLSAARMPCGLGLHPYFPCTADTVLDTRVTSVWTVDAAVLPVANVAASGRYDLRRRRICGQGLDNGFDNWSGSAEIRWPGRAAAVTLKSSDAHRFQVYSPDTGGLFVAEPVQNANAALNAPQHQWPDLGILLLEQGQERVLHARLEVLLA